MTDAIDALATLAVMPVTNGMIVGLGTGRAASRAINALARRVRDEQLDVRTVATSVASAALADSLGLTLLDMQSTPRVDYLFDGADEVTPGLLMLKGQGGAMTREKIVAHAASRRTYLVQNDKLVTRLGLRCPLPVEIIPFGCDAAIERLAARNLRAGLRLRDGRTCVTDNGNFILDVTIPPDADPHDLDRFLNDTPGIVGHGLFLTEADEILVEDDTSIRRLTR